MEYLDRKKEEEEKKKKFASDDDTLVVNETIDDVMSNVERDNPRLAKFRKKKNSSDNNTNNPENIPSPELSDVRNNDTLKNNEEKKENYTQESEEEGKEEEKEEEKGKGKENGKEKEKDKEKGKEEKKEKGKAEEKGEAEGNNNEEAKTLEGGGDGGGVKEPAKGEIEKAAVDTSNSDAYIKSLASNKPSSFLKEITENAGNSLNEARLKEKDELKKSLPELEQPTGLENKQQVEEKAQTEPEEGKAKNLDNATLNPDQKKKEENTTHNVPSNQLIQIPVPQVSKDDPNAKSKVLNAISNISTSDDDVETSPGDPPVVQLNGLADPNQNAEQKNQADLDVQENKLKSDQQSMEDHGENDIYPDVEKELLKVNQELNPTEEYAAGGGEQVPAVSQEVIQSFDEQSMSLMQEKLQGEITKSENQRLEMEQQSEDERLKNEEKIAEETANTTEKQKQEQNKARQEVSQQQDNWKQENEKLNEEYKTEAGAEQENVSASIETETTTANTEAETQYSQAEQEANSEKQRTEQEAERKKKEAENKEPSFWDRVADAIGDFFAKLKEGLNALFNALRKAVKFIIEKAKKAVTWLIDKARNAIIAFIKKFASFLKKLVSIVLAKFPALAKKINALIDKAVEVACEIVNALADALKKAVCFLLDALGSALDFILAAYQKFYNMILDALEFLAVGLIKIMKGIANLVSAAGQSPGHFLGQVSEELLGQDITKPLPNERPAPEAVSTEETKDAVAEGEMEQQDANVLNKKKYSPEDFKVDPVPHDMELGAELLSQIMSMGDGGSMEFGANSEPENDIESVKEAAVNGTEKESTIDDAETTTSEAPQPQSEAKDGGEGAAADSEMVGPFSRPVERGKYVAGKMIDGIKDFWNKNKVTILAALVAVIVGVILANMLTGGAVMAALPILFEVASVYFAAETMYNVMKYFGSYLGDSWPGQLMKGAVSLARAFAIGAIELVMALLFGGKAFLKGAKNAAKTARKGGVKGLTKMAKNAAKKEARQMMRNGKKLMAVGRRGGRNAVKNGKMLYKGMGKGFAKGSKSLDDLGKKLSKQFRFRKFVIRVRKMKFFLYGEINPLILLAEGNMKFVTEDELGKIPRNKKFSILESDDALKKMITEKFQASLQSGKTLSYDDFIKEIKKKYPDYSYNKSGDDRLKALFKENTTLSHLEQAKQFGLELKSFDGKIGQPLGKGGNKQAFEIEGSNDVLVLVHETGKNATIWEELAAHRLATDLGLPTSKIKHLTEIDGKLGLVMERYVGGSKDMVKQVVVGPNKKVVQIVRGTDDFARTSKYLNEKSISDLKAILKRMEEEKIWIDDLQFLIKEDGSFHIHDVRGLISKLPPSSKNKDIINYLIQLAEENVK